jgi:hypothetical protein
MEQPISQAVDEGTFDLAAAAAELEAGAANDRVGTRLLLENDRVRVWEVRLEPGDRIPFHAHSTTHFWTVVDAGSGRQRTADGVVRRWRYVADDTRFFEVSADRPLVHDLENPGDTTIRFITVELLAG